MRNFHIGLDPPMTDHSSECCGLRSVNYLFDLKYLKNYLT